MGEVDPLFEVRNSFYLGDFQKAIAEGYSTDPATPQQGFERDAFVYRAHIAQKNYQLVLDEIQDNADPGLVAVKCLAACHLGGSRKDKAMETVRALVTDVVARSSPVVQSVAATLFLNEGLYDEALRAVSGSQTLEASAQRISVYLRLHRHDLAARELKAMQSRDDLAPISQLAAIWLELAQVGGLRFS
jgi:coatomer protein complex subunit epsilon